MVQNERTAMPRHTRLISEAKIYHIVLKGVNSNTLFFDKGDYESFLKYFKTACTNYKIEIYAYCIMSNHIHLLLKADDDNIPEMFKSFGATFVPKYNAYHSRTGPMFNGRFYSSPINDDEYLFSVIRYIHFNPLKAGIVEKPEEYEWSSYREYLTHSGTITDREFIEKLLSDEEFATLHIADDEALLRCFIENSKVFPLSNQEIELFISNNSHRDVMELAEILKKSGVSKRKISSLLNIDRRTI